MWLGITISLAPKALGLVARRAPAAICRKVAEAKEGSEIEIWGDGLQTRSFLYVDECVSGTQRLLRSDVGVPVNIGSEEMISINDLASMVIKLSGKNVSIRNVNGPQGVRGRNSENSLIRELLGWEPTQSLRPVWKKHLIGFHIRLAARTTRIASQNDQ